MRKIGYGIVVLLMGSAIAGAATLEVRLEETETYAGSSGYLRVLCDSEIPLTGIVVPIRKDPSRFVIDSISYSHTVAPANFNFGSRSTYDGQGLFNSIIVPIAIPLPTFLPKNDELFRIHYTIPADGPSRTVVVDSFMAHYRIGNIEWGERLEASDDQGSTLYPTWIAGKIHVIGNEADTVSDEDTPPVPDAFNLEQNFPNPFRTATKISYSLPEESWLTIEVFDLLGRSVLPSRRILAAGGDGTFELPSGDLPSGIYFYRVSSVYGAQTRKMTILK